MIGNFEDTALLPIHVFLLGKTPVSPEEKRLKAKATEQLYELANSYVRMDVCQSLDEVQFDEVRQRALIRMAREARKRHADGQDHPHYETENQVRGALKKRIYWAANDFYEQDKMGDHRPVSRDAMKEDDERAEPVDKEAPSPTQEIASAEARREVQRGADLLCDQVVPERASWFPRDDWRQNFTGAVGEMLAIAREEMTLEEVIAEVARREEKSESKAKAKVHKAHQRARDKLAALLQRLPYTEYWDEWEVTVEAYVGMWRMLLELRQRLPENPDELGLPPEAVAAAKRAGREALQ